jgi:hypothetical protein
MHVKGLAVTCFLIVIACSVASVYATPTLSLSWYKNNGYGMGNDISGEWTITAQVSQNVTRVEFYIDNQLEVNDTSAPFSWNFDTANFTEGTHSIKAVAYDSDGQSATAVAERNFVGFPVSSIVGIILFVVVVLIVALVVTWFWIKKKARAYKKPQ